MFEKLKDKALADGVERFVVGAFITDGEGQVLLLQRSEGQHFGNFWEIPSGEVEEGESWHDALVREVREETGLEAVKIGAFVNSLDYRSGSGRLTRQHNFIVAVKAPAPVNHSAEHREFAWVVDAAQPAPLITPDMQHCIAEFLGMKEAAA